MDQVQQILRKEYNKDFTIALLAGIFVGFIIGLLIG